MRRRQSQQSAMDYKEISSSDEGHSSDSQDDISFAKKTVARSPKVKATTKKSPALKKKKNDDDDDEIFDDESSSNFEDSDEDFMDTKNSKKSRKDATLSKSASATKSNKNSEKRSGANSSTQNAPAMNIAKKRQRTSKAAVVESDSDNFDVASSDSSTMDSDDNFSDIGVKSKQKKNSKAVRVSTPKKHAPKTTKSTKSTPTAVVDLSEDIPGSETKKRKRTPKPKSERVSQSSVSSLTQKRKGFSGFESVDLQKVQALRKTYEETPELSTQTLSLLEHITEVKALPAKNVMACIENIILKVVQSLLDGKDIEYLIPSRTNSNQMYIRELDRNVLKNEKFTTRSFVNSSMVHKTAITTKILQLVHNILQRRIHITKRDMFYTDVKLFRDQKNSDAVLEDVACMIGCSRTSLNVVASEKGVVVGNLRFTEDGDLIDCSKMGIGGKGIPPILDRVSNIESSAKFVLLVEKDAAFIRLSEDRFYNKMHCIIVTAKGQPDVATRMFLRRLRDELKIPVLALVDSDPYGLNILSVYMSGSKKMSYDAASLVCPDIKWLGVRPSDLNKYNIPKECRLEMSSKDIERGQELLKEEFIQKNPEWVKELELMLKTKEKAEIQALSTFGFQFLTETYLPEKIANGDWL